MKGRVRVSTDLLAQALSLPYGTEIHEIEMSFDGCVVNLLVEHPSIPATDGALVLDLFVVFEKTAARYQVRT